MKRETYYSSNWKMEDEEEKEEQENVNTLRQSRNERAYEWTEEITEKYTKRCREMVLLLQKLLHIAII